MSMNKISNNYFPQKAQPIRKFKIISSRQSCKGFHYKFSFEKKFYNKKSTKDNLRFSNLKELKDRQIQLLFENFGSINKKESQGTHFIKKVNLPISIFSDQLSEIYNKSSGFFSKTNNIIQKILDHKQHSFSIAHQGYQEMQFKSMIMFRNLRKLSCQSCDYSNSNKKQQNVGLINNNFLVTQTVLETRNQTTQIFENQKKISKVCLGNYCCFEIQVSKFNFKMFRSIITRKARQHQTRISIQKLSYAQISETQQKSQSNDLNLDEQEQIISYFLKNRFQGRKKEKSFSQRIIFRPRIQIKSLPKQKKSQPKHLLYVTSRPIKIDRFMNSSLRNKLSQIPNQKSYNYKSSTSILQSSPRNLCEIKNRQNKQIKRIQFCYFRNFKVNPASRYLTQSLENMNHSIKFKTTKTIDYGEDKLRKYNLYAPIEKLKKIVEEKRNATLLK